MLIVYKGFFRARAWIRYSALVLAPLSTMIFIPQASASCRAESPVELNFQLNDVTLFRVLPIGSVIQEVFVSDPRGSQQPVLVCDGAGLIKFKNNVGGLIKSNVYSTNIAGIGYRVLLANKNLPQEYAVRCESSKCESKYPFEPVWQFQLIKTAATHSGGRLFAGRYVSVETDSGDVIANLNVNSAALTPSACTISTPKVEVLMGDIDIKSFSGAGSSAGQKTFSLQLNCDEQMPFTLTFNGEMPAGVRPAGTIALTDEAGGAQGVGLRMRYNGTPIALGEDLRFEAEGSGTTSLTFSAEYLQLKTKIEAGKANALATFNLRYD
jgi:type 1 fimbria pilin